MNRFVKVLFSSDYSTHVEESLDTVGDVIDGGNIIGAHEGSHRHRAAAGQAEGITLRLIGVLLHQSTHVLVVAAYKMYNVESRHYLIPKQSSPLLTQTITNVILWFAHGSDRDHVVYATSQWETTSQWNAVFHCLGTYTKWSLRQIMEYIFWVQILDPFSVSSIILLLMQDRFTLVC